MGVGGCHLLTEPRAVWKHLMRLRAYGEGRWAQRQRAKGLEGRLVERRGLAGTEWLLDVSLKEALDVGEGTAAGGHLFQSLDTAVKTWEPSTVPTGP